MFYHYSLFLCHEDDLMLRVQLSNFESKTLNTRDLFISSKTSCLLAPFLHSSSSATSYESRVESAYVVSKIGNFVK